MLAVGETIMACLTPNDLQTEHQLTVGYCYRVINYSTKCQRNGETGIETCVVQTTQVYLTA